MTTKQLLGQKCLVVLEGGCARPRRAVAGAIYVEVGKKIKFDAAALDDFDVEGCQPVHYDLLLICAAVEFADRRWKRPRSWGRKLHLIIPPIATGIWQNPDVVKTVRRPSSPDRKSDESGTSVSGRVDRGGR